MTEFWLIKKIKQSFQNSSYTKSIEEILLVYMYQFIVYIRSIRWNLKNLFVREPHFEVSQEQNMF